MTVLFTSFINALGWTLIHSLWQAGIIFIVLQILLKYLRHAPAKIRYRLSSLALTGIFICFMLTFFYQWQNQQSFYSFDTNNLYSLESFQTGSSVSTISITGKDPLLTAGWIFYIVLLYALGLLFFTGKVLRDLYIMKQLRRARLKPFDKAWEHYLQKLAVEWHIPRKIGLFLSEKIDVPVVIGYFKPVIYLPFAVAGNLSPAQIEVILLHELAHIKRCDFIVNILQTVTETILFFNPFVWWISKNIRKAREQSCDDLVVAVKEPELYAESLLALEENRLYKGRFVLAATHKKQQLFLRIKRIMEMKTKKLNAVQKLFVVLFMATALISVSWLTPGKKEYQQKKKSPEKIAKVIPIRIKDTTLPKPPPPSPVQSAVATAPPVSPQPPLPPIPPADSIPGPDSALTRATSQLHQYFDSDVWKKYQQQMKAYTARLKKYYQNKAHYRQQISRYFNSEAWKQQQEAIRQQVNALKQQFNSADWKQRMDSMRYAFAINRPDTDSILNQVRNGIAGLINKDTAIMTINNGKKNINVNTLISRLNEDGLLKDKNNYKIRFDNKGLFINGEKQPGSYYKKYHSLIGDNIKIKIKKNGGSYSYSSSVSISD